MSSVEDTIKLRDKGVLKAVVNIIDVIAHKLLGTDVWEQAEIDKSMVEALDGTKNNWCWSRANFSADATLAISTTVYRADAAESGVSLSLYTYMSKLAGKPADKFTMPVPSFTVISGGSRAVNFLTHAERTVCTTQLSKSTSSLVSCLVSCIVPLVVCDDAVVRLTLVLIAVAVGFVFVVAIFHRILLYWRYTVYTPRR